ncbi:hypothetical protein J2X72_001097 [Phyllobacterium sp. 1468]|uniref:hypothetical protein n=1 Tax=Phyllobacterium sp. 1468 TaxID=2817759 RepID=UPI0028575AF8|nr:hypothetical protein [Phyllobacterium sp. 1468]MDR6632313.1 hypothetical protein [Phyllobacterium sp. 1468]
MQREPLPWSITWIEAADGEAGVVMHGPYMPLRAGRYRVTWQIRSVAKKSLIAVCDVVALGQAEPLARCEVQSGETLISLDFDIPDTTFGIEFRCFSIGNAGFSILRTVELEENIERDRRSMVRE